MYNVESILESLFQGLLALFLLWQGTKSQSLEQVQWIIILLELLKSGFYTEVLVFVVLLLLFF